MLNWKQRGEPLAPAKNMNNQLAEFHDLKLL